MLLPLPQTPCHPRALRTVHSEHPKSRIVIHTAEGSFTGTRSWFQQDQDEARLEAWKKLQKPGSKATPPAPLGYNVATHFLVGAKGEACQFADTTAMLLHCGTKQVEHCNDTSIGIEHEGFTSKGGPYTDDMLNMSAKIVATCCIKHHIPVDREHIVGHVEIPGVTHTDPGLFWPWDLYMVLVRKAVADMTAPPKPRTMRPPKPLKA